MYRAQSNWSVILARSCCGTKDVVCCLLLTIANANGRSDECGVQMCCVQKLERRVLLYKVCYRHVLLFSLSLRRCLRIYYGLLESGIDLIWSSLSHS